MGLHSLPSVYPGLRHDVPYPRPTKRPTLRGCCRFLSNQCQVSCAILFKIDSPQLDLWFIPINFFTQPLCKRSIETNMHFTCNLNTNPTNPFSENLIYKQPHLNLISHLLAPKHKPHQLISATAPPQITPTGLVFWQGRVKLRSDLTLSNVPPHWQPLRGGLSKTDAS